MPGRSERASEGDEIRTGVTAARRLERQSVGGVLDPEAVTIEHDDRRGVARDERVPPPALGALDALEQQARSVTGERREDADRGRDVGEQLGPDRCEREPLGLALERVSIGTNPHAVSFAGRRHRFASAVPYPDPPSRHGR